MTTSLIQLITLALAAIALVLGAWLLIVGKRPWRGADDQRVAPRVRLLGLSYMLVFGSAMIQIILEPRVRPAWMGVRERPTERLRFPAFVRRNTL